MNELFYIVIRIADKDEQKTHSVQEFTDKRTATQRFYNIIAADLADDSVTYQYTEIRDCFGGMVDGLNPVIYDRRPINS